MHTHTWSKRSDWMLYHLRWGTVLRLAELRLGLLLLLTVRILLHQHHLLLLLLH